MGKGGQSEVKISKKVVVRKTKLDKMPTEELRKWAKAYGRNSEVDREKLIEDLVSPHLVVFPCKILIF